MSIQPKAKRDPNARALARADNAKQYLEKKYGKMKQVFRLWPVQSISNSNSGKNRC